MPDAAPSPTAPQPIEPGAMPAPAPSPAPGLTLDSMVKQKVNGVELEMPLKDWMARASKVEAADQYLATAKQNAQAVDIVKNLREAVHQGNQDALRKAALDLGMDEEEVSAFFEANSGEPEPAPAPAHQARRPAAAPTQAQLPQELTALVDVIRSQGLDPAATMRVLTEVAREKSKSIATSEVDAGIARHKVLQSIKTDSPEFSPVLARLVDASVKERLANGVQYGPDVMDAAVAEVAALIKGVSIRKPVEADPVLGIGPGPSVGISETEPSKPMARPKMSSGDYDAYITQQLQEAYRASKNRA